MRRTKGAEMVGVTPIVVFTVLLTPKLLAAGGSPLRDASIASRFDLRNVIGGLSTDFSHDQHRARRMPDDALRHGSEQKACETLPAMRAYHDELHLQVGG